MAMINEMDVLREELEVLQSVYCLPGECEVDNSDGCHKLMLKLRPNQVETEERVTTPEICLTFYLSSQYPTIVPQVSIVSAYLRRDQLSKLRQETSMLAQSLQGQAMLADLISFVQEYIDKTHSEFTDQSGAMLHGTFHIGSQSELWTALLQLDHMRGRNKYVKTIQNWCTELGLEGKLLFQGKLILILLQGPQSKIKDFIIRQKSVRVDVDSRGRSCKEKLMRVLCEQRSSSSSKRFTEFEVKDCETPRELQNVFTETGHEDLFHNFVETLQGFHL
ncbi:RWD domain-containing protein 3-like [Ylistrum balloti]|uniref:RWD domain-containing protein 3-like n=1 Tax=Ylistrum balloti TaxID=509963 RepID=UPI002905D279|nr:RWD domain-containing protein 3-like [Ylistrum balloti]XP_060064765.1 RWD domain-containing protein 3-like [Ylistrum balloti]XP_060064766.1 RWD domain-containing protein 3-like [Ylistrum balloti]XP_060064767.1 RWD domain-containing protein 3-like [Ylistrum balloti]